MSIFLALVVDPEVGEWGRKIVEVYMSWYTFFITANIVILGWFFGKETHPTVQKPFAGISFLFFFLNVLGAVSTIKIAHWIATIAPQSFSALVLWSAWANCVALLGIAIVWAYLILTVLRKKSVP